LCFLKRRHAVAVVDSERALLAAGLAVVVVIKPLMKEEQAGEKRAEQSELISNIPSGKVFFHLER
jgi:hypothetical protein